MIDLTPLDVRNKRGDFKKNLRGYDPQEVDVFLELVAERLEVVVRENIQLRERSEALTQQVSSQSGREKAVQEALVTAQELRSEIRSQAERQADLILQEAQAEGRRQRAEAEAEVRSMMRDAERRLEQAKDALEELERRRNRFIKSFRQLLEREMDVVEVEEASAPLEERPIEMDLGGGRTLVAEVETEPEPAPATPLVRPITFPPGHEVDAEEEDEEDLSGGFRDDVSRLFADELSGMDPADGDEPADGGQDAGAVDGVGSGGGISGGGDPGGVAPGGAAPGGPIPGGASPGEATPTGGMPGSLPTGDGPPRPRERDLFAPPDPETKAPDDEDARWG